MLMTMVRLHVMRLNHRPLTTLRMMVVARTRDVKRRGFDSGAPGDRGLRWSPRRKRPSANVLTFVVGFANDDANHDRSQQ